MQEVVCVNTEDSCEGSTCSEDLNPSELQQNVKSPGMCDSLPEYIRKAIVHSIVLDVSGWQKVCKDALSDCKASWHESFASPFTSDSKSESLQSKAESDFPSTSRCRGEKDEERSLKSVKREGITEEILGKRLKNGCCKQDGGDDKSNGRVQDGRRLQDGGRAGNERNCSGEQNSDNYERGTCSEEDEDQEKKRKKNAKCRFKCEACGKAFPDNFKLERHIRVHTGEKPFDCSLCGKSFAHKENLIVHRRVHLGLRPFRCETCGKGFVQRDKLTVHRRVHTGDRPFRCLRCGKAFKDSSKLKRHQRLHV